MLERKYLKNAESTLKRNIKECYYVRVLDVKRNDGRNFPGWKTVKARQARVIILMTRQL